MCTPRPGMLAVILSTGSERIPLFDRVVVGFMHPELTNTFFACHVQRGRYRIMPYSVQRTAQRGVQANIMQLTCRTYSTNNTAQSESDRPVPNTPSGVPSARIARHCWRHAICNTDILSTLHSSVEQRKRDTPGYS